MNYKLIIKEGAELDANEAALWYNEHKKGLGIEFLLSMEQRIDSIKLNPYQCAVRYRDTRIAFTKRFPYGIHYKIEDNRIVVVAILHTSRDPQIWKMRD